MKIRLRFVWILLFCLCFQTSAILAFGIRNSDFYISEYPALNLNRGYKGYVVYRFLIENLTNSNKTIEIELRDKDYNSIVVSKKIELIGNDRREERIFIPANCKDSSCYASFTSNGKIIGQIKNLPSISSAHSYSSSSNILLDKKIPQNEIDKIIKDIGLEYRDRDKFKVNYFGGTLGEMDTNWISYTQYDALLFYASTFSSEEMPESVRQAILNYIEAGGTLLLIGEVSDSKILRAGVEKNNTTFDSPFLKREHSIGFGYIYMFDEYLLKKIKKTTQKSSSSRSSSSFSSRFSKSLKIEEKEEINSKGLYEPKDIVDFFGKTENSFKEVNSYNKEFSVVSNYEKDYTLMFLPAVVLMLVIIFAIIIGPINFFYLNYYDKKILIFATVPIISAISCSLIFLYFLIFEFNRLDIYRQSFTFLNEKNSTALTCGAEIIVSGRTLNNSLVFPISSVVIPKELGYRRSSFATKEIVLDKTQNFTKGWIRAKAPFGYSITSIKPDRSRLEVIDKSLDSCVVLNGLGADIEYICYCSSVDDKSILTGENIIAGKKGQLKIPQSIKRNDAYSPVYAKKFLEKDMTKKVLKDHIDTYALEKLKPGEYVAVLKTNPFMKQGFDWRGNIREYACIVHGMPN